MVRTYDGEGTILFSVGENDDDDEEENEDPTESPTEEPTEEPTESPTEEPTESGALVVTLVTDVVTDESGEETRLQVIDKKTKKKLINLKRPVSEETFRFELEDIDMENGCYVVKLIDTYGDGICCGEGNGSLTVEFDGETLMEAGEFRKRVRKKLGGGC